jgi:hypothetical protein
MGTRSTIGMSEGYKVKALYCQWDGYPEGAGGRLAEHYTDAKKVRQLLELGNLSALRQEIGEAQEFNSPKEEWTIAYGRDRGETGQEARTFTSVSDWLENFNSGEEYFYLYTEAEGWAVSVGKYFTSLKTLEEVK